jgi:hypothetical protein
MKESRDMPGIDKKHEAGAKTAPASFFPVKPALPEDPEALRRFFPSLPLEEQRRAILGVHGKQRLDMIFLSETPGLLVESLAEFDLLLTIRAVGDRDALDLIALASAEQVQYFLDLDLWKKDGLDPDRILHWVELLLDCGTEKVAQFVRSADLDQIVLILKQFLNVSTATAEEPLEEAKLFSLFTLDQFYYISFNKEGARALFEPFLKILHDAHPERYRRVIEGLMTEVGPELEEHVLRFRNSRLNDYGFPDFEEALEIYRFINPDTLAPPDFSGRPEARSERKLPVFYVAERKEGALLSSLLARIEDPAEAERLTFEITSLCNKAVVAEAVPTFDPKELERVTRKVYRTLNLALESLSRGEEGRAFDLLAKIPVQKLFQAGASMTVRLRRRTEALLNGPWFEGDRENLRLLDLPHLETFEGLLRRRPALCRQGACDDFGSVADLRTAESFLDEIGAATAFLQSSLRVAPGRLRGIDLVGCQPEEWQDLTLSTLFLTGLANRALGRGFEFAPVEKSRLNDLLSFFFRRTEGGKGVIRMEIKEETDQWLSSAEEDETRRQHLRAFRDFCLDLFEMEYGKVPPEGEIDPRFVKGLLVRL